MTHLRLVTAIANGTSGTMSPPVPTATHLREFGEQVAVLDSCGRRENTGRIVGRVRMKPAQYDVFTENGKRLCGIPEDRVISLERV